MCAHLVPAQCQWRGCCAEWVDSFPAPPYRLLLALPPSEEIADSLVKFLGVGDEAQVPCACDDVDRGTGVVAPQNLTFLQGESCFFSGFDDQNTPVPTGRRRQLVPEIEHDT